MPTKPRFETSSDVEKCMNYLRSHAQASYYDLSGHLSRDIRGRDRYILQSARRKLEREGLVFVTKTGVGVERADHAQVASLATQNPIDKIRRTVRRSNKRQKIVDIQSLTADERAAFFIGKAVLGAIGQAAREAFRSSVERATETNNGEPLSVKETLNLFRNLRQNETAEH